MAPRLNLFEWWARETAKGAPVIVKMENPSFSIVEIDGADAAFKPVEKSRLRNAKQVRWILLLKANRVVGCVAWLAAVLWKLLGAMKKRLIQRRGVVAASEKLGKGKLMLKIIKLFLVASLATLAFELVAHFNGWHYLDSPSLYIIPRTSDIHGLFHSIYVAWLELRSQYIAPFLHSLSLLCVALFVIQSLDRLILCLGCLYINLKKIKPTVDGDPFRADDPEGASHAYPMVLVQIPMCNEREVSDSCLLLTCVCACVCFSCVDADLVFLIKL